MLSEYADTRVAKQNDWRFIKMNNYEASARLQDTRAKTTGAFETKLFTPRELAVIFGFVEDLGHSPSQARPNLPPFSTNNLTSMPTLLNWPLCQESLKQEDGNESS
jgi:hypothetical protein